MTSLPKRVIIISELYYPEQNATGYFLTGIAEALALDRESKVSVLCAQPSYNQRTKKSPKHEFRHGVQIRRCPTTTLDPHTRCGRLCNFLTVSMSLGLTALLTIQPGDTVLGVTNPPLLPYLLWPVCWLRRAKFVLLVHDMYPEVLVPLRLLNKTSLLYKLLSWVSGRLYAYSDTVVALGRDMEKLIRASSGGRANIAVIPNWGDTQPAPNAATTANRLLKFLGISDRFIIQFSGNHGRTHDLETILSAARLLQNERTIHFLFIGEGSSKAAAVRLAKSWNLQNVTFTGFVDRSELPTALTASHISVVAFKPGMTGISVPSRLYNLMAAQRPIIAVVDEDSEVAEVIRETQAGVLVQTESPRALADAILELMLDDEHRTAIGRNAKHAAEQYYSYNIVTRKYLALFKSLRH